MLDVSTQSILIINAFELDVRSIFYFFSGRRKVAAKRSSARRRANISGLYLGRTAFLSFLYFVGCNGEDHGYSDHRGMMPDGYVEQKFNDNAYDGEDCCQYTCGSDIDCGLNGFDALGLASQSDLSSFQESPPPASSFSPCPSENQVWEVKNTKDVQMFTEALNCSDGRFDVEWEGIITIEKAIHVVNGTLLNIMGVGADAVIDGGGSTNLFVVRNASLHLSNVQVGNGRAIDGGAIESSFSALTFNKTTFIDNVATRSGGLFASTNSIVSFSGESKFIKNQATKYGGAIYVGRNSSASWNGVKSFLRNTAGHSGGAIFVSPLGHASWKGNTTFTANLARVKGGAVVADGGSSISWEGFTKFTNNALVADNRTVASVVKKGGALVVWKANVSWSGETIFANNAADNGGAIFVQGPGRTRWDGNTIFSSNTASNSGGAVLMQQEGVVSWTGNTTFSDNSANWWGGGAVAAYTDSNVSWEGEKTTFSGNTGPDFGGAIFLTGRASASWSAETRFFNNSAKLGGALAVRFFASASWSAETNFLGNSAENGGALFIQNGADVEWIGDTRFSFNDASKYGGAVGSSFANISGNSAQDETESYLTINANTNIENNTCAESGGGIAFMGRLVMFVSKEMTFAGNSAADGGGGVFISKTSNGPKFEGAHFSQNFAKRGGGVYSTASGSDQEPTTFKACKFVDNTANTTGGAMYSSSSKDSFVDTCFTGNSAVVGGGLDLAGEAFIKNCSFVDNASNPDEGPAISNHGTISSLTKSSFSGNSFHCVVGMYLDFKGDAFEIICDQCIVECDYCDVAQLAPRCISAVEHSTSPGGIVTIEELEINQGYWRASNSSTKIFACYNADACVGGITGEEDFCANGYEGPYCSVCRHGYSSNLGFLCFKCSYSKMGILVTVFLAVVGVVVVMAITMYLISPDIEGAERGFARRVMRHVPLQSLKIVINAWQILTQFSAVANVTFPGVYQRFLDGVNFLNFDLSWVISVGCIVDVDFHAQLLISTLVPIVIIGLLRGTYAVAVRMNRGSERALRNLRHKNVSVTLLVTFLVYSSVSATLFQMFACDNFDDGSTYLRADYRIRCDSTKHRALEIYAGFMIALYPVGIPALYAVILLRSRHLLRDTGSRSYALDVKSTSDLWKPYKPSRFYYEVIECGRRITLTGVVVFIYPNTAGQIAMAVMMSFAFTVLSECLAPYDSRLNSWLNRTGNIVVFTSMFLALLLKVDISSENANSQEVFEAVFVTVNVCMILSIVVEAVVTACVLTIAEHDVPRPTFGFGIKLPACRVNPSPADASSPRHYFYPPNEVGGEVKKEDSMKAERGGKMV